MSHIPPVTPVDRFGLGLAIRPPQLLPFELDPRIFLENFDAKMIFALRQARALVELFGPREEACAKANAYIRGSYNESALFTGRSLYQIFLTDHSLAGLNNLFFGIAGFINHLVIRTVAQNRCFAPFPNQSRL